MQVGTLRESLALEKQPKGQTSKLSTVKPPPATIAKCWFGSDVATSTFRGTLSKAVLHVRLIASKISTTLVTPVTSDVFPPANMANP